jgi:hypothetical protein
MHLPRTGRWGRRKLPTSKSAIEFIARSTFPWHQQFELAPSVLSPNPVDILLERSRCRVSNL